MLVMNNLEQKIYEEYVRAMKSGDKDRTGFLSFLRAELKNSAIDLKKQSLDDSEVLSVLNKQKKRLQETKESAESSGRKDILEQAERELSFLKPYLPEALGDKEVSEIVDKVISELGAASMKDMGRVMKEVLAIVGVRADSRLVSGLVKEKLSSLS